MVYVSAYDKKRNMWGVTDTDDGVTEVVSEKELLNIVKSGKVQVSGVDVVRGYIHVVRPNTPPYPTKRPANQTRQQFLDEEIGFDYIIEQHETREFTQFVVSTGGDVNTYRVYGEPGSYKVYAK